MIWLRTIVREVLGLFVDDAALAGGIVLWIAAVWLLWPYLRGYVPGGVLLFVGLAVMLLGSTVVAARGRSRS